jgi:NitT/TauT family transport system substrate-binding protein
MAPHSAAEKVTVQLKWLPQAQFAGYYVAAAKGYYKAEPAWT